jgi:hypothetical protein
MQDFERILFGLATGGVFALVLIWAFSQMARIVARRNAAKELASIQASAIKHATEPSASGSAATSPGSASSHRPRPMPLAH